MPVKLETSLRNIQLLDNSNSAKLIHEFYLYLRSVNTSESYQNQNIKGLINIAKFFEKDLEFIRISKKEEILLFLNTKIKNKERILMENGCEPGMIIYKESRPFLDGCITKS